jgi:hypothetical protein
MFNSKNVILEVFDLSIQCFMYCAACRLKGAASPHAAQRPEGRLTRRHSTIEPESNLVFFYSNRFSILFRLKAIRHAWTQPTTLTIEFPGIVMLKEPPTTEIRLSTAWFSVEDVR